MHSARKMDRSGQASLLTFCVSVFASFFLCVPAAAVNPDIKLSQYAHTAWRLQDGLVGSSPFKVTQTQDGYVWIGTTSGVLRFDGNRFVSWAPLGHDFLRSVEVTAILGTNDGDLWIGTRERGLLRWDGHQLAQYLLSPAAEVASIMEDRRGSVWIAEQGHDGAGHVCEVMIQKLQCYGASSGIPPECCLSMTMDRSGDFWLGLDTSIVRWTPRTSSTRTWTIAGAIKNVSYNSCCRRSLRFWTNGICRPLRGNMA
jgi:ligand-binding sensor domain-containing protein